MHQHLASALPILIATFTMPIVIWSSLFAQWTAHRAGGRRAVEAELKRLGERAVSIDPVPLREVTDRAGLLSQHVFRVTARTADGAPTTHLWAYEAGLVQARRPQHLKRLAHGIWIPA